MMPSTSDGNRAKTHYYNVKQVAARLQVDQRTVRRLMASGVLPHHRFGRAVRISEEDLLAFEKKSRR
jgi:excisionase family DNA binding protein